MIDREASQFTMLGLRLREIREHCGLTQIQLARRLKVSPRAVGRWERGGNGKREAAMRFIYWQSIAQALNVARVAIFYPVGHPIRTERGKVVKQRGEKTLYQPITFKEAETILQCSPRVLAGLIRRGDIKVVLVQMIKPGSLYRYIAKRARYNGG